MFKLRPQYNNNNNSKTKKNLVNESCTNNSQTFIIKIYIRKLTGVCSVIKYEECLPSVYISGYYNIRV